MESKTHKYKIIEVVFNNGKKHYKIKYKRKGFKYLFNMYNELRYTYSGKEELERILKSMIEDDEREFDEKIKSRKRINIKDIN